MKRSTHCNRSPLSRSHWMGGIAFILGALVAHSLMAALPPRLKTVGFDEAVPEAPPLLAPADVENGLRSRLNDMGARRELRRSHAGDEPRDYSIQQPPPEADTVAPPDAPGGEMLDERIEVLP